MKLTIPELEISDNEGFLKNDIFNRTNFGEKLANLVDLSNGNVVIALDADWGEGKTTFIKMWRGHIEHHREKKTKAIYFDAFANDYRKDPFMCLVSEIYESIDDNKEELKKDFKQKTSNIAKSVFKGSLKTAIRVSTAGLIDGSAIDSAEQDISKLLSEQVDKVVPKFLEESKADKNNLHEFKSVLESFAEKHGENPVVFIIDELDRCRPDFALELFENIKHLFSVKNIVFLLVVNRKQLEQSIRLSYGTDDANNYLQKFINLWIGLPIRSGIEMGRRIYDREIYINYLVDAMLTENESLGNTKMKDCLIDLSKAFKPSFRQIERMMVYVSIIHNSTQAEKFNSNFQYAYGLMVYVKVMHPILVEDILSGDVDAEKIIKTVGLDINTNVLGVGGSVRYLPRLITYDFADEDTQKQMIEDQKIFFDSFRMPDDIFIEIAKQFSNLNID